MRLPITILALAAGLLAFVLACGGGGDDDDSSEEATATASPPSEAAVCNVDESDPSEAYRILRPSVVFIAIETGTSRGVGSGFVLDEGEVITNAHVVAGAEEIRVEFDGGRIVAVDPGDVRTNENRDVAYISVDTGGTPPVDLGRASDIESGQRLIAIGYPILPDEEFPDVGTVGEPSISDGIFSAMKKLLDLDWLVVTVPINPGNSGGPMADLCGVVYGISTAHYPDSENVSLAVPGDEVDQFAEIVRAGGGDAIMVQEATDSGIPVGIEEALRAANISLGDLPPGFIQESEEFTTGGGLPGDPLGACGEALGIFSDFSNEADFGSAAGIVYLQSGVFSFLDEQEASDCFAAGSSLLTSEEFISSVIQEAEGDDFQIVIDGIFQFDPTGAFDEEETLDVVGRYLFDDGTEVPFENFTVGFRSSSQVGILSVYSIPEADFDVMEDLAFTLYDNMTLVFGP